MKFILNSFLLISVFCFPVFSQEFSITKEVFSKELSALAELTINSVPDRAAVYIDDAYMGVTDISLPLPSAGPHLLKLRKPGYDELSISFHAEKNTGLIIDTALRQWIGTLNIKTNPADALILADGITLRQGVNELASGSYTVIIKGAGRKTHIETVRIFDGGEKTLSIELKIAETKSETSAPSEKISSSDYPFSFFHSQGPRLFLCPEPGTLPQPGIQFITQMGYEDQFFPFSAGLRAVPIGNLEISAVFISYISLNYIEDTAVGAAAAVKYSLNKSVSSGFNAAAALSGTFISAAEGSPYNSRNCLSLTIPLEYVLSFGCLKTGLTISPGLSGSFYLSDGTAAGVPVLKLLTPAGVWLRGKDFRIGLSASPEYPEFGYGFPGFQGFSAALEAGIRIPGTTTAMSVFGSLGGTGVKGGAAVSFVSF
ncbi:MAG: PEGA domain-containing protein [Spirochaetales bacterium]|nr:PEGA domain-containing protein [Spirochaetales bacterium]